MSARISLIAAVGRNRVIGAENAMPWRLPGDFAFFKKTTMGKPLVMGRKTFESIGKALPGRINIVVTHDRGFSAPGVKVVHDLEGALALAETEAADAGVDEIMIGGGGAIYAEMIGRADRLYITHVEAEPAGDTRFPPVDPAVWAVVDQPEVAPDPRDTASFRVRVYERRRGRPH